MPRLFTALEVPGDICQALSQLRGGLPGARWVEPRDYHITLCFIGDIDNALAQDVAEALERLKSQPVDIVVEGVRAFGSTKPKSVYAGVHSNPALQELQAAQKRLLHRLGIGVESRNYTPHITLAHLRSEATASLTAEWLSLRDGGRWHFTARRFVLLSSRDSVGGGPYIVEAEYSL